MLKVLFFIQKQVFSSAKKCGLAIILGSSSLSGQTSLVYPNSSIDSSVGLPYSVSPLTYQFIIDDSQLTTIMGKYISSISFRLGSVAAVNWPPQDITFPDFQVFLSNGVEPADRQFNFSANVWGTLWQAKSGSLVVPAGSLTAGTSPNAFSYTINFDQPYYYPSGNLLVEIRHTGNSGNLQSASHAVHSSAPGVGSLFTSIAQYSGGGVVPTNFAYVKIGTLDQLSVEIAEPGEKLKIFPNPVNNELNITAPSQIIDVKILSLTGQKLSVTKADSETIILNLSYLPRGVYVVEVTSKNGVIYTKKFTKN